MTLAELRDQSEGDNHVALVVTDNATGCGDQCPTVYSITQDAEDFMYSNYRGYRLNRYFQIGGTWYWSCDLDNDCLRACMNMLTEKFEDTYPKGE